MTNNEDQFKSWIIPELDESEIDESEDTTLFGKPASWYRSEENLDDNESIEDEPTPLTLDDIEGIRKSAYEDGFNEGKEAGLLKGIEEGTEQGLQDGIIKGTEQGIEKGLVEGQKLINEKIATWESLIERLHNPLDKLDSNVEYQLIHLATTLAEQITRCEVQLNPQIILQALKQAVDALPVSEQTLKILLHPDDLQFVQTAYSQEVCAKRGWDLQGDPVLLQGDCQIHTQTSSIDYAFTTRIEQVLKHFFKNNHDQLPENSADSNLLNDQPMSEQTKVNEKQVEVAAEETNSGSEEVLEEEKPENVVEQA